MRAPRAQTAEEYAPKPRRDPKDEMEEIAHLTAAGVTAQYEAAAAEVQQLGVEVKERVRKIESALAEANADLKMLTETATAIREKGKLVALQIEEAAALSKDIRTQCSEFKLKLAPPIK